MLSYKKLFTLALFTSGIGAEIAPVDSGKVRIENIMSHQETGIAAYNNAHITYTDNLNLAEDLNIPQIAKVIGCKTVIGETFLVNTLKTPVSPSNIDPTVTRRQKAIRALVENPALKEEVERLLTQAQQEETAVIALMSDFFVGKACPELEQLELIRKKNPRLAPIAEFFKLNPTGRIVELGMNGVNVGTSLVGSAFFAHLAYQLAQVGAKYTEAASYSAYFALLAGIATYSLQKDYFQASEKRSKIHALNKLIGIAQKLEGLCVTHAVETQFKISDIKDAHGKNLVQGLQHSRYRDEKSLLFFPPPVHTFLYKVYQQEKHLAELFACLAEMDAYNAIATQILASQKEKNKFCFATFIQQEKSAVHAHGFWNVLVKDAVPSSLSEDRQIILTGPNAGGKTTTIRAILQNIVLAQTFGVAAAESFEVTPFDVIHSYLAISDDLLHGLSLFASEIKRAKDILGRIKGLSPAKKYFFALDELFTGTVAEDGETCAYEFVKKIATFQNVQFIYATHFAKLKELGHDNAVCANYQVDAPSKDSAGKLAYPFTLSKGASNSRVALDIAREANLFD